MVQKVPKTLASLVIAASYAFAPPALATDIPTALHQTETDGHTESGWVVSIPAGSSDWFSVRYDLAPFTVGTGVSVSVVDFGSPSPFPRIGAYESNTAVDPTGNTPNLSTSLTEISSPALGSPPLYDFVHLDLDNFATPFTGGTHVACQFPPGDSGLIAIGTDTDASMLGGSREDFSNPHDRSFFTTDGFSTPGIGPFSEGDFGLNLALDSCQNVSLGGPLLRIYADCNDLSGDFTNITTRAGDFMGLYIHAEDGGAGNGVWMLFLSANGVPLQPAGPILPLGADGNGCEYARVCQPWPCGFGGLDASFLAFVGTPGIPGSVSMTNEISIRSLEDPETWGVLDDGTYESGWSIQVPAGSSDYFNVNFGFICPQVQELNGLQVAVMDFATSLTSYPSAGVSHANYLVDPTGNSPDLTSPYVDIPFPFPALTFVTTSGQMIEETFSPFLPGAADIHAFIQCPPQDQYTLALAGDNDAPVISNLSGWTIDGYDTPATIFPANWGLRISTD